MTGEIVRSFLSGTTAWSSIGTAPASDPYLKANGAMFAALVNSAGAYASDLTSVEFGTVPLQDGGDLSTIFYYDFVFGTGTLTETSQSLGSVNCGSLTLSAGYTSALRCKLAVNVLTVTPLVSGSGRTVTAGGTVTLTGGAFGSSQCSNCKVQAVQAGSSTVQTLTVTSWTNTAISVKLPAGLTGLLTLTVVAATGPNSIGVVAETASTIAVTPTSLQFAYSMGEPNSDQAADRDHQ